MNGWMQRIGLPAALIGTTATIVLVQSPVATSLPDTEVNKKAKEITVQISGENKGSGVIIERKGNTYTVLTNWHVVNQSGQYRVTTHDDKSYTVEYTQIKRLIGADLALVYFTSSQKYSYAEIGNSDPDQLSEGQKIHYAGYPASVLSFSDSYSFYSESINSRLPSAEANDGYEIIISGAAIQGMSGGPILDENAHLIGIYGKVDIEPNTGDKFLQGIPINTAKELSKKAEIDINWSVATVISPTPPANPKPDSTPTFPTQPRGVFRSVNFQAVDIAYQPNANYIEVDFQKLVNPALQKQYEGKLVSFTAFFYSPWNSITLLGEEIEGQNVLLFLCAYDRNTFYGQLNSCTNGIGVDKSHAEEVFNLRGGDILKIEGKVQLVDFGIRKRSEIFVKVHRFQKIGTHTIIYPQESDNEQRGLELAEKIEALKKALVLNPKEAGILFTLGNAYFQKGDYQEATAYLEAGLKMKPDTPAALFDLGNCYLKLEQFSQAISSYEKAITVDRNFWPAINNIGLIEYEQGNIQKAIQQWEKAIAIDSNQPEPKLALAVATYAQGNQKEGIKQGKAALAIDSRYADLEFLRENLWGKKLLEDAKKFLAILQPHS